MSADHDSSPDQQNYTFHTSRHDCFRPKGQSFDDLAAIVFNTYNLYEKIERYVAPYNARQISANRVYIPPTEAGIKDIIGSKSRSIDQRIYDAMIRAAVQFCNEYKTSKQLPLPHPVTHHSAHFLAGMSSIVEIPVTEWLAMAPYGSQTYHPASVHMISLVGCNDPIYIENYRPDHAHKYLIVRPKIAKTGTSSAHNWEVVLSKGAKYGFAIENVDAPKINPRFAGVMPNSGKRP